MLAVAMLLPACETPDADLPAAYRDIAVPAERLASAAAQQRGRDLFVEYCALCHGKNADGRGERREGLSRPPADFTDASWRKSTTPRQVYHVIREGVRGTSMASWKALSPQQTWDLVAYLLSAPEPSS
jgi:mono/diheme cytochrome c family protein